LCPSPTSQIRWDAPWEIASLRENANSAFERFKRPLHLNDSFSGIDFAAILLIPIPGRLEEFAQACESFKAEICEFLAHERAQSPVRVFGIQAAGRTNILFGGCGCVTIFMIRASWWHGPK
jgi:hypothetical protein